MKAEGDRIRGSSQLSPSSRVSWPASGRDSWAIRTVQLPVDILAPPRQTPQVLQRELRTLPAGLNVHLQFPFGCGHVDAKFLD